MSPFDFNSLLASIFEWTWKTSLSVTVLIGLVVLIQALFRKILPPRWSYALWLLVVLRMMLPAVPSSSFSVFNLSSRLASHFQRAVPEGKLPEGRVPRVPDIVEEANVPPASKSLARGANKDSITSLPQAGPDASKPNSSQKGNNAPNGAFLPRLLAVTPWLWLTGAAGYFLSVLIRHGKLVSWVKRQPASSDPGLQSLLRSSKATLSLSRDIEIIVSRHPGTAAIFCFFKPRLLLPKAILERLDSRELRFVILHELVHVKRRDVLLNWLLIALQSLHWFNPAVWLALRRLKAERELACDGVVMAKLAAEDRHVYGSTLIKLLDESGALAPSLVPIINHKHEIQRRITMIAQFKPTPRIVSIASAMLLLALGCFTFTSAAEKPPPTKAAEKPKGESGPDQQREIQERGIKALQTEWEKLDNQVKAKQAEVDSIKVELGISDLEEARPDPEYLRKLEGHRIEANAEFAQRIALYSQLTNLSRADFKKAASTVSPDSLLTALLGQQSLAEQKLAELTEKYAPEHPEVKSNRRVLDQINSQVNDRLDGILQGLKALVSASKAKLDRLKAEVDMAKSLDIDSAIKRRPYFQAKRDLESLQLVRERLQFRLIQEKVDQSLERADSDITFSGERKPR